MLKIEKYAAPSPEQWEMTIEGARNPLNSWDQMDSGLSRCGSGDCDICIDYDSCPFAHNPDMKTFVLGPKDTSLLMRLARAGTDESKFRRMLPVHFTVTAPLYWWKEFDTYKVGTVANSCSTMHKITAKEFVLEDFSMDHLMNTGVVNLCNLVEELNIFRNVYINGGELEDPNGRWVYFAPKSKDVWWQLIQLLPTSYNQKRTVMANYEVLGNIYKARRHHKLDEWHILCDWIEKLPYSELITCSAGGKNDDVT